MFTGLKNGGVSRVSCLFALCLLLVHLLVMQCGSDTTTLDACVLSV